MRLGWSNYSHIVDVLDRHLFAIASKLFYVETSFLAFVCKSTRNILAVQSNRRCRCPLIFTKCLKFRSYCCNSKKAGLWTINFGKHVAYWQKTRFVCVCVCVQPDRQCSSHAFHGQTFVFLLFFAVYTIWQLGRCIDKYLDILVSMYCAYV